LEKTAKILLISIIMALIAVAAFAEKQTVCPIMGGEINKDLYVDADGKRIYVCCEGCIEKVKADPQKYIEQLESQGITLEKTPVSQTVCPVMGRKINKDLYVDADGKRIYVCCEGCIEKVKADPQKYIKLIEEQGITLYKTSVSQTVCPIMGGKIDKNLYVDADDKSIYACCAGCIEKIKANPQKYIEQLENQGITLEKTTLE